MSLSHSKGRRSRLAAVTATLVTSCSFAFAASASAAGNFVIGDQQAVVGAQVTFWGAQWWKLNSLSGGTAPAAFKGFANTIVSPSACGGAWTTDPGNSSDPPVGPLPPFIDVLVSSTITKSGRIVSGDTNEVVSVATDPGYAANPGHAGTGTVVSIVCRAGENSGGGEGEGGSGGAG
jgi:hypothetical protein